MYGAPAIGKNGFHSTVVGHYFRLENGGYIAPWSMVNPIVLHLLYTPRPVPSGPTNSSVVSLLYIDAFLGPFISRWFLYFLTIYSVFLNEKDENWCSIGGTLGDHHIKCNLHLRILPFRYCLSLLRPWGRGTVVHFSQCSNRCRFHCRCNTF